MIKEFSEEKKNAWATRGQLIFLHVGYQIHGLSPAEGSKITVLECAQCKFDLLSKKEEEYHSYNSKIKVKRFA